MDKTSKMEIRRHIGSKEAAASLKGTREGRGGGSNRPQWWSGHSLACLIPSCVYACPSLLSPSGSEATECLCVPWLWRERGREGCSFPCFLLQLGHPPLAQHSVLHIQCRSQGRKKISMYIERSTEDDFASKV